MTRTSDVTLLIALAVLASCKTAPPRTLPLVRVEQAVSDHVPPNETLRPVADFARIEDDAERSAALFLEMSRVITHPRCTNCHPSTDRPLQGDASVPHEPPVTRGADGHGTAPLGCATCHGPEHGVFASGEGSVPGNAHWALAPVEMAWAGVPVTEICKQIRDPSRNGGLSLEALVKHNTEDTLVGYGWNPGPGREPAPGSQALFGALTRAWVDTGAVCPSAD